MQTEWQLKRQQPVVSVEARRASGRSARQQPAFNLSSSYLYHTTRCAILLALRAWCTLIMPPQGHIIRLAPATHKTNTPNLSDRWRCKCYVLSLCMFPHAKDFMPVNVMHLAENVQQRPLGSHFSGGLRILCNTRLLSLLDRDLASRIDCSSLGPPMLTLNFIHWILQLTLACWIWGLWKHLSLIF